MLAHVLGAFDAETKHRGVAPRGRCVGAGRRRSCSAPAKRCRKIAMAWSWRAASSPARSRRARRLRHTFSLLRVRAKNRGRDAEITRQKFLCAVGSARYYAETPASRDRLRRLACGGYFTPLAAYAGGVRVAVFATIPGACSYGYLPRASDFCATALKSHAHHRASRVRLNRDPTALPAEAMDAVCACWRGVG